MADAVQSLAIVLERITGVVQDEADFRRGTRCAGWSVQDLLFHLLLDAQRALVVLALPVRDDPDTDAVSYWRARATPPSSRDDARHATFVRRASAAYAEPAGLVTQWKDTSTAVLAASSRTAAHTRVSTQGHVLTADDFTWTLVVEAALHLLDLRADAADWGLPADVTAVVRSTLEALLGRPVAPEWDDTTTALVLTGRVPVPEQALWLADRVPVLR